MFQREAKLIELFTRTVKAMCAEPDRVEIAVAPKSERCASLRITATSGDAKRLIGELGSHFAALRKLLRLLAFNSKMRFALEPIASLGLERAQRFHKFAPRDDWQRGDPVGLLRDLADAAFPGCSPTVSESSDGEVASVLLLKLRTEHRIPCSTFSDVVGVIYETVGMVAGRILHVQVRNLSDPSSRHADSR